MWSSEQTPVLTPPSHSWILPEPSPMEPSYPSFKSLGSVESAGCRVDKIVMERMEAELPQQQQQQRGRTAGKKRAVFGRVRHLLLSRSRSASRERPRSAPRERSLSTATLPAAAAAADDDDATAVESRFKTAPAPRRLFSSRRSKAPAAEEEAEETGGCVERPRSDRMGREENFHVAMENKLVHGAFASFCKKTLAWENIEFVLQVRELHKLSMAEGTTTGELREKLRSVAAEFVSRESATEVNVEGDTREEVLCSIQAALEAEGTRGRGRARGGGGGCGESPWAWVLAVAATEALVDLAREVQPVIFDGLWPRFLASDEFTLMMNTQEMRTAGFTDLDGKLIVSALPPQHPGGGGGRSSTANKRQLSSRLASSFRATRMAMGGGGGSSSSSTGSKATEATATPVPTGVGGCENIPPSSKTASPASVRSPSSTTSIAEASAVAAAAAAATTALPAVPTALPAVPTALPPLGRSRSRRPSLGYSRPPRSASSSPGMDRSPIGVDRSSSLRGGSPGKEERSPVGMDRSSSLRAAGKPRRRNALSDLSSRWIAASHASRADARGEGCGGGGARGKVGAGCGRVGSRSEFSSSPSSPTTVRRSVPRSAPFSAAATARRAFSLR